MAPVGVKVPVVRSYKSALARRMVLEVASKPPAISTFPSLRSVAVWRDRLVLMLPVGTNVPCWANAVFVNVVRLAHNSARTAGFGRTPRKRIYVHKETEWLMNIN